MRFAVLLLGASLLTALVPAASADLPPVDAPTPVCAPILEPDGSVGAECGLANANCAQVIWGIHSEFLTVGGRNGCHVEVSTNPNADPETPGWLDGLGNAIDTSGVPVQCYQPAPRTVVCWIENGEYDLGVVCGVATVGVGAGCALLGVHCTQALWGIHQPGLVIGGYNGCNVVVWANPQLAWE